MTECKYCNHEIEKKYAGSHVRWCKLNPTKSINKEILPKCCKVCNTIFIGKRRLTCSNECAKFVSSKTKNILSEKRKNFLLKNPDKHPWKQKNKYISVPCQNVKNYLTLKNIKYIEEYSPLKNRSFSIDIAFPHIKTGIEINGNQHYTADGKLKQYYQERHDIIESSGWKLIEIHYSECFSESSIQKFLNFDIPHDNFGIIDEYFSIKKLKELNKINIEPPLARGQKIKDKNIKKWEFKKNEIFNHSIDFSKHGWVTKVANIIEISPQKVNKWMKQHHEEFFESKCYKRKSLNLL